MWYVRVTKEGKKKTSARTRVAFLSDTQRLDYIADCVDEFLTEQNLVNEEMHLHLGYTFSFPVLQSKVEFVTS